MTGHEFFLGESGNIEELAELGFKGVIANDAMNTSDGHLTRDGLCAIELDQQSWPGRTSV